MDAIQQDVSENEERQEDKILLSRQQAELERIAAKVEEEYQEDEVTEGELNPQREEHTLSPLHRSGEDWYATAKVNGEEVQVSYDELLAQYQKNSSADQRLQEASEKQRELEAYEARLNDFKNNLELQNQPSPDAGTQESPSNTDATDALYEQYHDALFQGDEPRASKLLKQIRSVEKPRTNVDVSSIIERTKAEMREEEKQARERGYETRRQDAVKMFHEEYPDITGDSSLLAVADRRSAELYQDNPTRDPWDIMQECGEYARTWLMNYVDELGGAKDTDRQARKQDMDEVVPKTVRAHLGDDEAAPTYSDIITEIKKERGQPY